MLTSSHVDGAYIDFDTHTKGKPETADKIMKSNEALKQKIEQMNSEREKMIKKIEALKRNYEGLSNSTKKE